MFITNIGRKNLVFASENFVMMQIRPDGESQLQDVVWNERQEFAEHHILYVSATFVMLNTRLEFAGAERFSE